MLSDEVIKAGVVAFIVDDLRRDQPVGPIDDDTPLVDDGVLDSLGIFSLLDFIEDTWGVIVEPEEITLGNFEDLAAICRLVRAKGPAGT